MQRNARQHSRYLKGERKALSRGLDRDPGSCTARLSYLLTCSTVLPCRTERETQPTLVKIHVYDTATTPCKEQMLGGGGRTGKVTVS